MKTWEKYAGTGCINVHIEAQTNCDVLCRLMGNGLFKSFKTLILIALSSLAALFSYFSTYTALRSFPVLLFTMQTK